MATTTNYSWTTPDDTDLVKDGASAIRTLGSSADTTVKNLNPGTTAGDIDYYTSGTAKARIAIGTAGQVLQVNSGATAPEWAAPASGGGMTLINTGGTTLTGASVSIQSIPGTYNELVVYLLNAKPATNAAFPAMIYNNDGTAKYRYAYDNADDQSFGLSDLKLTDGATNDDQRSIICVRIPQYASTTSWKFNINQAIYGASNNSTVTYRRSWGAYNQYGNAITRLDFYNNTGNWSAGTVYVYGVK